MSDHISLPLLIPLIKSQLEDFIYVEQRGFDFVRVEWKLYFKYMIAISDRDEILDVVINQGFYLCKPGGYSMGLRYDGIVKAYEEYLIECDLLGR